MTNTILRLALITNLALLAGCGESHEPDDGGPLDSSVRDAGRSPDASDVDAGDRDAGAVDAGTDAGTEPCAPDETRVATCGSCGRRDETCLADETWDDSGPCLGQGECPAGDVDIDSGTMCFERRRTCDATCNWQSWEDTAPAGECEPGATRTLREGCPAPQERTEFCLDSCEWVEDRACHDDCVGTARSMPWHAEEVCVGEGTFLRGTDHRFGLTAMPQTEVYVSSLYIDRYPVTNTRYRACVGAGVCAAPASHEGALDYADPAKGDHPVHTIYYADAETFCAWDGGRRLPTEAEWEKAARGPAPRDVDYPWGGAQCDHINFRACGWRDYDSHTPDPVNAYPATVSYYGVDGTVGIVWQFVSDWYGGDYYTDPSSLRDPQGPDTGSSRVMRGGPRNNAVAEGPLWQRRTHPPELPGTLRGFRCARDGD